MISVAKIRSLASVKCCVGILLGPLAQVAWLAATHAVAWAQPISVSTGGGRYQLRESSYECIDGLRYGSVRGPSALSTSSLAS